MSEHRDGDEPEKGQPAPSRRPRTSIREVMGLVAAVAICLRWPGLSVPVGLAFLYVIARRREILRRPTRVAFGQVALALYLPTALGIFCTPVWWWDTYTNYFSLMPSFFPATLILGLDWVVSVTRFSPAGTAAMVVLSLSPLGMIGGLVPIARRELAWRIGCLILAAAISTVSLLVFILMFSVS